MLFQIIEGILVATVMILDFSIQADTRVFGLSIVYTCIDRSQTNSSKIYPISALKIVFVLANSIAPDEMLHQS